ncbi:hypothetical protein [Pontibacter vulgaris]|uniref:hypothetical protein n=1 Tax=Pontibacter vulgaris TaxID=2905679 RepID=UPI001FA71293|nr:hypothetical protein [Pontibacter vulgaris]
MKNRFLPAMLLFGVVALSSCEKTEQDEATPLLEQGMISHVMVDSAEVTSYNFSGSQLSQVNHYNEESGKVESYEQVERDSKGRIQKIRSHAGNTHALLSEETYTYNDKGNLDKTTTAYYTGTKVDYTSYATYEFNAQNKLEKKSVFEGTDENAQLKSYTTYAVLPNGNYTQEKEFVVNAKGEPVLFSTTTYSYDANTNPFYGYADPATTSSPNNILSSRAEMHGTGKVYTYSYSYEYDERGYPTSQTVTNPNGKRETYTYLYSN